MQIYKAVAEDAEAVWDLRRRSILSGCRGHYDDALLRRWTEGDCSTEFAQMVAEGFYLAREAGELLGSVMLDCCNPSLAPSEGQLEALFVVPEVMGQGVGKALLAFAERLAQDLGLKRLRLEASLNALPFYRACGFGDESPSLYVSPRGIILACHLMYKNLA